MGSDAKPTPGSAQAGRRTIPNEAFLLETSPTTEITGCRILVVDDDELNRLIIGRYLEGAGFYNIDFAADGVETLEKCRRVPPDIVVLDIIMPGIDGFEVCRRLRERPETADLPVLVQTALESADERSAVFEVGATDLIGKPIHENELVARVRIHLENQMLLQALKAYRDRVSAELEAARNMQEGLRPGPDTVAALEAQHGVSFASIFEPSSELGGDLWTAFETVDGKLAVLVTDLSGHGVTAAINAFRLHTLVAELQEESGDPSKFLSLLNDRLVDLIPRGHFATAFYGVIDTRSGQLRYAAAAAPAPVIITERDDAFVADFLDGKGLPLGILRNVTFETREVALPAGTTLFVYSDVVIEAVQDNGEMIGEEGLSEIISQTCIDAKREGGHASLLAGIVKRFFGRTAAHLDDDLTLVMVSVLP